MTFAAGIAVGFAFGIVVMLLWPVFDKPYTLRGPKP